MWSLPLLNIPTMIHDKKMVVFREYSEITYFHQFTTCFKRHAFPSQLLLGQSYSYESKSEVLPCLPSHTKAAPTPPHPLLSLLQNGHAGCLAGVMPWHGLKSLCCNAVYTYKHSKLK